MRKSKRPGTSVRERCAPQEPHGRTVSESRTGQGMKGEGFWGFRVLARIGVCQHSDDHVGAGGVLDHRVLAVAGERAPPPRVCVRERCVPPPPTWADSCREIPSSRDLCTRLCRPARQRSCWCRKGNRPSRTHHSARSARWAPAGSAAGTSWCPRGCGSPARAHCMPFTCSGSPSGSAARTRPKPHCARSGLP